MKTRLFNYLKLSFAGRKNSIGTYSHYRKYPIPGHADICAKLNQKEITNRQTEDRVTYTYNISIDVFDVDYHIKL